MHTDLRGRDLGVPLRRVEFIRAQCKCDEMRVVVRSVLDIKLRGEISLEEVARFV